MRIADDGCDLVAFVLAHPAVEKLSDKWLGVLIKGGLG